jgi:hypothetical protein
MSRFRASTSYGHRIRYLCPDCYRVSWVVDRYYPDSRLRHPRRGFRVVDKAGAMRFAKRWKLNFQEPVTA